MLEAEGFVWSLESRHYKRKRVDDANIKQTLEPRRQRIELDEAALPDRHIVDATRLEEVEIDVIEGFEMTSREVEYDVIDGFEIIAHSSSGYEMNE